MVELLYHKRNRLIMTVVDGNILQKMFKTITREKNVRRSYFCSAVTMTKL